MKIGVLIKSTTYHKNYGGMETQNKLLCEELARRGYQVVVFSPQRELTIDEKCENGVKYVFVDSEYNNSLFSFVYPTSWYRRSLDSFKQHHSERKFDVAITQSSAGLSVVKKKRELGISVISVSHGTIIGEYKSYLSSIKSLKDILKMIPNSVYVLRNFFGRQREFIHGSDVNVAVSSFVKKSLVDETFVDESKVVVINNGIKADVFLSHQRDFRNTGVLKIMYSGRIHRSKGIFELLKLASFLKEIEVHCYGDGEDFSPLKKQLMNSKISNFHLHGRILYKDMVDKYFYNDILVLPSIRVEGLPMVIIEAMFSKMPIIASDIGGISDAIKSGKTGLLISPGSFEDLVDKVKILVESQDTRRKVGEGGLNFANENFTVESMVDKYEKVIKRITK